MFRSLRNTGLGRVTEGSKRSQGGVKEESKRSQVEVKEESREPKRRRNQRGYKEELRRYQRGKHECGSAITVNQSTRNSYAKCTLNIFIICLIFQQKVMGNLIGPHIKITVHL